MASLTAFAVVPAQGQQPDCGDLPGDKQAACWMILACAAIDDEGRRRDCFSAAAERFVPAVDANAAIDAAPETEVWAETVGTSEPEPTERAPAPASATVTPSRSASPAATPRTGVASPARTLETADSGDRGAVQRALRSEDARPPKQLAAFTVPNRFSAKITGIRRLVRDRHLVALDDRYLFEGERARVGRFELGDDVDVVRTSSLFGRRYRMTSSTGRPLTATRIRCEQADLSASNRRKCEVMLGRASVD